MPAILKSPPDMDAVARLSKDPIDNSTLHTTCVATRLNAGHANNALPQRAEANVNCRILPGHSLEEIRLDLVRILADPKIEVRYVANDGQLMDHAEDRKTYAPPPLRPDVMEPLDRVVQQIWPGVPVVPTMATGASDSIYTNAAGMVTYGISGDAVDRDDIRAHGRDERLGVESFYTGVDFFYRYLKAVTSE
jgi:acetylornithine deacetylase/succinyl-diaminopimelate desuccinylase-like protein